MKSLTWKAINSRLLVITLQAIFNYIIPDHDAGVFLYPKSEETKILDPLVETILGGLTRWDAQYFMHISIYGYTYENSIAFFPLLPYTVRIFSYFLTPILSQLLSTHYIILLTYIIFNTILFVLTAHCLYKLTTYIYNTEFAAKCADIFCYNPASIFFSAPYTECMFCYLTLNAILHSIKIRSKHNEIVYSEIIRCVIYISLSISTRSNGLVNIGFLIYFFFTAIIHDAKQSRDLFRTIHNLILFGISIVISILPFVLIQFMHYFQFCTNFELELPLEVISYGEIIGYVMVGEHYKHNQTWCDSIFPRSYSYVQEKYWNVGFLKYYELKQIPNFLLASPVILLVLLGAIEFIRKYPKYFSIHFIEELFLKDTRSGNIECVCMIHGIALTIVSVFFVHIQVTTRMLFSATPIVYWIAAKQSWTKYYFWGYFIVGTFMFCNFLPWT